MKIQVFFALVVGTLLCNAVQAQHVLSHFTPSSYEKKSSSPRDSGADKVRHDAGISAGHNLPSWWGGDFGSHEPDNEHGGRSHDRKEGPKLYGPLKEHPSWHYAFGKFDDFEDEGRHSHDVSTSGPNQFGLPANCSPIPESPIYSALLGMTAFSLAMWHRRFSGVRGCD